MSVDCRIYSTIANNNWLEIVKEIELFLSIYTDGYLWHYDPFKLSLYDEKYLVSHTRVEESLDDEMFIVFLMKELTTKFNDLVVSWVDFNFIISCRYGNEAHLIEHWQN